MRHSKSSILVLVTLTLITVGGALLTRSLPILRAAQELAKSPRALLQVVSHPPQLALAAAATGDREGFVSDLQTQAALIRSRLVLEAALHRPGIAQLPSIKNRPHPIAWLEQIIEVTPLKDTELLQVSIAPNFRTPGEEQAALINAVVDAYMTEVAVVESRRRADRSSMLKRHKEKYAEMLRERRQSLQKWSSLVGGGEPLTRDALPRLYLDLRTQRVQVRLDRAEAETRLARRKTLQGNLRAGDTHDRVGQEIDQLEDRLASLSARQKVLDEELERVVHEIRSAAVRELDLSAIRDEIAQLEEASGTIATEIKAMNVELATPPRIRLIDRAAPPGS